MSTLIDLKTEQAKLGDRLRLARQRRRLSQQSLAERMNVAKATVVKMESEGPKALWTLLLAYRALSMPLDEISSLALPENDAVGLSADLQRARARGAPKQASIIEAEFGSRP